MRKILFRGKSSDTNEWVYGYYEVTRVTDTHVICGKETNHSVIPESVGEYTGIIYKNERIFEGDIFEVRGNTFIDKYFVEFESACFIATDFDSGFSVSLEHFLQRYNPTLVSNLFDERENTVA